MKKKNAFTLAEVLITLGIIGIVAAITLPALVQQNQKKVVATRLKQTYSQVYQAINMAQADYGDMKNWGIDSDYQASTPEKNQKSADFVKKYIAPYMKSNGNPSIIYLKDKGYGPYLTKDRRAYLPQEYQCVMLELPSGVTLFFSYNSFNENGTTLVMPMIYVDTNGKTKPNTLGQDFYVFYLDATKTLKLIPYGNDKSRDYLLNACKRDSSQDTHRNLLCTALIVKDGWEIKDDYPW